MTEALVQALINGVIAGIILAVPALGFTAIFAVLNYPNFAIGALATVGAYAGWMANAAFGLPAAAALPAAFAAAGLAGLALQRVAVTPLERSGALMMAIASLAAGLVVENMLRFAFGNDLRGFDLPLLRDWRFGAFRAGPQQMQNFAFALGCMALLWAFLRYSRTGRAMRAVADNRDLALLRGVDPPRVAAVTVMVGAGLAGMGGMLVGLDTAVDPLVGTRLVLSIFAAAVLGGLGSIPGAVAGAIAIGVAEEVAVLAFSPAYRQVVGFVAILLVLTLRPAGFFGVRAG